MGGQLQQGHDGAHARRFEPALSALRHHVAELQLPQIASGRRAIVLFEGPDGAGKKAALRELAAALDPCAYTVHCCDRYDRREAAEGHWLAPFWSKLPRAGHTAIFFRSWYRRLLDDRVLERTREELIARTFDEINEFEAQQRDCGTLIVKLYFDVDAEVQEQRLADRARSPWASSVPFDETVRVDDPAYERALADLMAQSNTRWSPWRTIDGNDERAASVAVLEAIADAWSAMMPTEPQVRAAGRTRAA